MLWRELKAHSIKGVVITATHNSVLSDVLDLDLFAIANHKRAATLKIYLEPVLLVWC